MPVLFLLELGIKTVTYPVSLCGGGGGGKSGNADWL